VSSERIRYVRSADGARIAWTESGSGAGRQTVVLAANHITDIKNDANFQNRHDQIQRLNRHFRVVRYDHRGCGSSQRNVKRQGQDAWVEDLEAVVRAASPDGPVVVSSPSQSSPYGAAFAAQHPELVSRLIIHGGYSCGGVAAKLPEAVAREKATLELIRVGWDTPNPQTRMLVATAFFPEPTADEIRWAERLPDMINREDALRFFEADALQDARKHLGKIRAPALVTACADDPVVLPEWSRIVAAAIPGAQYVELAGKNHIPVVRDPFFEPYFKLFVEFAQGAEPRRERLGCLSRRERQILDGLCAGLNNEAIALERDISPKTVRNHLTRIFDKLQVNSRTQAILLATRA
jgi:pimeloyl-ACP methyl ester carboxylesterase/DNA-binding CsgD family transcriptional regulator